MHVERREQSSTDLAGSVDDDGPDARSAALGLEGPIEIAWFEGLAHTRGDHEPGLSPSIAQR
jgi:hypothetical protein